MLSSDHRQLVESNFGRLEQNMRPLCAGVRKTWPFIFCSLLVTISLLLGVTSAVAQPQARVLQTVNNAQRVTLTGNTHPLARPEFDHGAVEDSLPMTRILMLLKRSDDQEAALQQYLEQVQDKSSANYHAWLTPEQFGAQYGPADSDVQAVTQWLTSQGLRIEKVYSGKMVVELSGTAGQVRTAFGASIHNYQVNGKTYTANANDPQIPAALAPVVAGIVSLNNFPRKSLHHEVGIFTREKGTARARLIQPANPELTFQCGTNSNNNEPIYCNVLVPYDFATIYNVLPLWQATPTTIDGTGETIALVAASNVNTADIQSFRSSFGLPAYAATCSTPPTAGCLNVIVNGPDPGLNDAETEADLDTEWSGAVARRAAIDLVVSADTESSSAVDLSSLYIVDNDLAPVMSVSFGECELFLGSAGNQFYNGLWEQAAAEGISVFVAAGDSGSAACDIAEGATAPEPAKNGLAVSGLASTPFNFAVGGTDFNDLTTETTYWNTTSNNPTTQQSALSYIPETTWNDSCTNALFATIGYSSVPETNCNDTQLVSYVMTVGGSGGQSNCTTPSGQTPATCSGQYALPSWQTGSGVPLNGGRAVPDVSLFSGDGFVGNAYAVCEQDRLSGPCATYFLGVGGTSGSSPAFAGIMALINQKTGSRQGSANIVLYKLFAKQIATSCNSSTSPASTCIFNDVTSGTNAMPCAKGSPNCVTSVPSDQYGVLSGYTAGAGYDLATGLGSVNAANLVSNWSTITFLPSSTTLTASVNGTQVSSISITHGSTVSVSSDVSAASGTGTPTGQVALMATPNPTLNASPQSVGPSLGIEAVTLSGGVASGSGVILPGGTYTLTAHYQGDATFGASNSVGIPVTISPEPSKTFISIPVFNPTTGVETGNAPNSLVYGSPYVARIDVGNAQATLSYPPKQLCAAPSCPTGNITLTDSLNGGTAAPLDGGTFGLNSEGYTEDMTIQLGGGQHVLSASYVGDNSYNPSVGTYSLTVTPAPTKTSPPTVPPGTVQGSTFPMTAGGIAQTQSGIAPTGTLAFLDDGTPLGIPVVVTGQAGASAGSSPSFFASSSVTISTGGMHTVTAQYSGDSNYAPSNSSATVSLLYHTTANLTATPATINYGSQTTLIGVIDTAVPTTNTALKPGGTVYLTGSVDGPVGATTTASTDASGNWQIQVTATFTPSGTETFNLSYTGDSNYASVAASGTVIVNIPDFGLGPSPLNVVAVAGQTGSGQVTITPLSQSPSIVNLSASLFYISGYSLSISPQQVSLNGTAVTATVTFSPTITVPASEVRSQTHHAGLLRLNSGNWWLASLAISFGAFFTLGLPKRRRKYRIALGLTAFGLFLLALGCGGGSGSSGGGGGTTGGGGGSNPQATSTTLTTSNAKVGTNAPFTLTATVTGAGSSAVTGTVDFHTPNGILAGGVPIVNGQAQLQAQGYFTSPGVFQITAYYNGDANHLASQSSVLVQAITGTVQFTVGGKTGTDTHSLQGTFEIQ
jgi:Pro-kumamolisin, activation domain/Bacterial Ig-like domain (group 3)